MRASFILTHICWQNAHPHKYIHICTDTHTHICTLQSRVSWFPVYPDGKKKGSWWCSTEHNIFMGLFNLSWLQVWHHAGGNGAELEGMDKATPYMWWVPERVLIGWACAVWFLCSCSVSGLPFGSALTLISLSSQCFSQDYATAAAAVWRQRRKEGGRKLFKVLLLPCDQNTGEMPVTASPAVLVNACYFHSLLLTQVKQSASRLVGAPPLCSHFLHCNLHCSLYSSLSAVSLRLALTRFLIEYSHFHLASPCRPLCPCSPLLPTRCCLQSVLSLPHFQKWAECKHILKAAVNKICPPVMVPNSCVGVRKLALHVHTHPKNE